MVLGICFRLLANSRNTDSVTNTAAATVRQVRMLCFTLCMLRSFALACWRKQDT